MDKVPFAALLLSSTTLAQQLGPDTEPGRLFLVDIDGERVVYQAEFEKIWYPRLSDTFRMTLPEQLEFIEQLEYAGIRDWRIGYYWDTTPLKWSMFGHVTHPGGNTVEGYDTSVYFTPTSETTSDGVTVFYTHGRTGDEWGDPDSGGNGAVISTGTIVPFGLPSSSRYSATWRSASFGPGRRPARFDICANISRRPSAHVLHAGPVGSSGSLGMYEQLRVHIQRGPELHAGKSALLFAGQSAGARLRRLDRVRSHAAVLGSRWRHP